MKNYNWSRFTSGGWWLHDTAPGTLRTPIGIASRFGVGYRGALPVAPYSEVTAGSMGAAKARLLAKARETEDQTP